MLQSDLLKISLNFASGARETWLEGGIDIDTCQTTCPRIPGEQQTTQQMNNKYVNIAR